LGIVQFGLTLGSQIGLINATREAARYGSTLTTDGSDAATVASNVYCYAVGYVQGSNSTTCSINGTTQTGVLKRSMPLFNITQLCATSGGNCNGASTVSYCYYQDAHGGTPTYSIRLNVTMIYRHSLLIPLISAIIDGIDGHNDNAIAGTASEQFRVEGPPLTDLAALQGYAITSSWTGACSS
jgi:hypothetical protein